MSSASPFLLVTTETGQAFDQPAAYSARRIQGEHGGQCHRLAERGTMTRSDLVGNDAQPIGNDLAHELGREEAVLRVHRMNLVGTSGQELSGQGSRPGVGVRLSTRLAGGDGGQVGRHVVVEDVALPL